MVAVFSTAVILGLTNCKGDNPAQVAGSIINSFSGSCSASGSWAQSARADTQALIQIFEELKNKDQCKDLSAILQQMSQTAASIHNAYGSPAYLQYRQKEEELQELTLALSTATDPQLQQVLSTAIVERQRDLAVARAAKTIEREGFSNIGPTDQYSVTTGQIASNFNNLFNYRGQLSQCLEQSPGAVMSLFSNLASVAGSFVSPALGSNLNVLSSMLTQFLGYLSVAKIDSAIWDLYDSQMPLATTCGLESMTNFYCQAEDAAEIVMTQANSYDDPNKEPDNFWKGIDLIARHLPVLNNWLLQVKSGIVPQDDNDAKRVNSIIEKRNSLETTKNEVLGKLNRAMRLIERTDDVFVQKNALVNTIAELAKNLSGSGNEFSGFSKETGANPFRELEKNQYKYACYLAVGINGECIAIPDAFAGKTLETFIGEIDNKTKISINTVINDHWPLILDQVTKNVLNEFNDIIFIDPSAIISEAHEDSPLNLSPREALVSFKTYLEDLKQRSLKRGKNFRVKNIDETIVLLTKGLEVIDDVDVDVDDSRFENNPLIDLYNIFHLNNGIQFISDRASRFVDYDLNDRLEDGELPRNIADIIRSSNQEILKRLTASGVTSLNPVKRDLDIARGQARSNFQVFRKFMLEKLDKVVISENKKSIEIGESLADGPNRIYGQNIAHLCLLIYSTGDTWPSKASEQICKQSVFFSVYPDRDGTRKIEIGKLPAVLEKWNAKPLVKNKLRICSYYNFLRSERLFEVLKKKTSSRRAHNLQFFGLELILDKPLDNIFEKFVYP